MIKYTDALQIAKNYVASLNIEGVTPVIIEQEIKEHYFGWVFFYQSKEYLDTKNVSDMLGGNVPIIVNKYSGAITVTGTAYPIETYIEEYKPNIWSKFKRMLSKFISK